MRSPLLQTGKNLMSSAGAAARNAARPPVPSLQRRLGNQAVQDLLHDAETTQAPLQTVPRAPGQQLPASVREEMEARFGQDFSTVRVHAGPEAAASAEAMAAKAFTYGTDIVFGAGHFASETASGRELLAHELAHVVQQSRGGAAPTEDFDHSLESGAHRAAAAVAHGSGPVEVSGASGVGVARQQAGPLQTKLYPRTVRFRDREEYDTAALTRNLGPPTPDMEGSVVLATITTTEWLPYPEVTVATAKPAPPPKPAPKPAKLPPKPDPPVSAEALRDIADALAPRLIYPKPVRQFFGGLQFVGGGLEAGFGGIGGIATAETGVGLAAGGFVFLHGADVASSGWTTMWTGEASKTYTFRLGAGAASIAGADPKMQNAVGQSADLFADIGSAGLSLSMIPSPAIALTPEAEIELRMARMAQLETRGSAAAAPRSAGAAGLNDWSVFTPPGEWRVVKRPATEAMEMQAIWSGRPYEFSGNNILVLEYHAEGIDFDRALFDQFGSLESLNEFKWTYEGSIASGNANVATRLRGQALRQIRAANELGVPLEWHVMSDELPMFRNVLGPWRSNRITWVPYDRPPF